MGAVKEKGHGTSFLLHVLFALNSSIWAKIFLSLY